MSVMSAMSITSTTSPTARRWRWRVVAISTALLMALAPSLLGASSASAARSTSSWLAGQVSDAGSVIDPYGTDPSVDWTVNVALALIAAGDQGPALERAVAYIEANAGAYVTSGTSDQAGHLSWLILLAMFTERDAHSFGIDGLDLVAMLQARYGIAEPGLFGTVDDYTPVTNQALAIIALRAAGATVPAGAIIWLRLQQCEAPAEQAGGWQGYRPELTPGVLADCEPVSSAAYNRADAASTSFAMQAIADLIGVDDPAIAAGVAWLHRLQSPSAPAAGGFGQYIGDTSEPNSTALVIQALRATETFDQDWSLGGGDPALSMYSWVIVSGDDDGALASPYSSGSADLYATYQGIWGVLQRPLPTLLAMPVVGGPIDSSMVGDSSSELAPAFTG